MLRDAAETSDKIVEDDIACRIADKAPTCRQLLSNSNAADVYIAGY